MRGPKRIRAIHSGRNSPDAVASTRKMLGCIRALFIALVIGSSFPSIAQTPADGQVAYDRGDYPAALRIWTSLADLGNPTAQVRLGLMYARGHGVPRDDAEAVRWYRKAAEQGFAWGETNLGYMYSVGRGVDKDDAQAVEWYRKAAATDFAMAQDNLGVMYRDGRGVTRDPVAAVDWFRKAAAVGYLEGQNNLGYMYASGQGVAQDDAEAVQWYRKAAERGHALAQTNLGWMYENGRGVAKDYAEAVQWYRRAAEQGNARAQTYLGNMYLNGRSIAKNDAESARWYRKAADQGNATGQANLGYMYASGRGVAQDYAEAVRWYRKAADQGNEYAQRNLGSMYENGRGVAKDDAEAVQWYRKAAEQGNAAAQRDLGVMYENGRGVPKDEAEAVQWYRRAVDRGYANAEVNLGSMYENGRGVAKDEAEAARWYRKAADHGNANAQAHLGTMYRDGRGVPQDPAAAKEWFAKAAKQGDAMARTFLASIERPEPPAIDLVATIAELVKKYEAAQPAAPVPDAERAALAREIIEASATREALSQRLSDAEVRRRWVAPAMPTGVSQQLRDGMVETFIAAFRVDRILELWERKLADSLDVDTLRVGLHWEQSELGSQMNRLEREAASAEQRAAKAEFAKQFVGRGATVTDARGRACAQKDIFDGSADSMVPILEAMMVAGGMIARTQGAPSLDTDEIGRMIASMRPLLVTAAHQAATADCLFAYRELTDDQFDRMLEFLRTDSGGRYARGANDALRGTLLDVTEVFTRTLIDVARQFKGSGDT